jgi:hypothetical protein
MPRLARHCLCFGDGARQPPCPVTGLVYGAVVALEMSLLPKFAPGGSLVYDGG